MREVRIQLRPLPGSPWIKQHPAYGATEICFAREAAKHLGTLKVIAVRLNGRDLRYRMADTNTVVVHPLVPLQADRLDICCEVSEAAPMPFPTTPLRSPIAPSEGYGFQART